MEAAQSSARPYTRPPRSRQVSPRRVLLCYPYAVSHVFEPAPSGRSKCRGCGKAILRGELRFGERLPNPYGEGEMSLWFHPLCAAYKRPEPVLQSLEQAPADLPDREQLQRTARAGMDHERLPRIDGAERAPTSQAKCRHCHESIARGTWRIKLMFFEEGGRFSPGGFLHLECGKGYFETDDILERLLHFNPDLSEEDRNELTRVWQEQVSPAQAAQS
jgi:hypothetical protein